MKNFALFAACAAMALGSAHMAFADVVNVGSGSYTTTFPGVDAAGRNTYPSVEPNVSGYAATRPVPTNDWWSRLLTTSTPINMFNYPMGVKPVAGGLDIQRPFTNQALSAATAMMSAVEGLTADATVSNYSDWTVTINWTNGSRSMEAIVGQGMPMVYFTKNCVDNVTITYMGSAKAEGNLLIVTGGYNGASYAVFAPTGSTWSIAGGKATSSLNGKNYWTVAMLPDGANATALAHEWEQNAFAFPVDTRVDYDVDTATGTVTTNYNVTVDNKEGSAPALVGLLPHHWGNLADPAIVDGAVAYSTVRGQLKMVATNRFTTKLTFHGILPTMPAVPAGAEGFSEAELESLCEAVFANDGLDPWTDSYNDGQLLNRLVQTGRIADEAGFTTLGEKIRTKIREKLQNWLSYDPGEVAFLFYYHKPYGTLLGYPAGHGQDSNINDHHFHWGYLIGAAAYLAQHSPTWATQWGPMVEMLIRDAASGDRNDPLFPYQRSFSPYAGHCWANGLASIDVGVDQESTSESMQFHSNLLHWAEVTGNTALRDQAIYMYATEVSATDEYWFDIYHRNLDPSYNYFLAARVFSNNYDFENFWGGGVGGSLGIHVYPMHTGSFYLMHHPRHVAEYWKAMTQQTGILNNADEPNTWYDTWWQVLAMIDPEQAITLYEAYPDRNVKFGCSPAQTYQWIHSMNAYGRPNMKLTANSPMAVAFDKDDVRSYVVMNHSDADKTVKFSDGFSMAAPAHKLTVAQGVNPDPVEDLTPDTPTPGGDDDDPTPGEGGGEGGSSSCTYTGTEAETTDGGPFHGPYTVTFATEDNKVVITASFEGDYVDLVPGWIFNESNGFAEIAMSAVEGKSQTYTGAINGVSEGDIIKARVKIAYAGGLSVTKQFIYTVGDDCGSSAIIDATADGNISLDVYGATLKATAQAAATLTVWSTDGRMVVTRNFNKATVISLATQPKGVYIARLTDANGATRIVSVAN